MWTAADQRFFNWVLSDLAKTGFALIELGAGAVTGFGERPEMSLAVIEKRQHYLENPTPGDYWNEMMCPQLLVLAVNKRGVHVITDTVNNGDRWMWDFDKARTISADEFKKEVRYCYCYHKFHESAVGLWKEHIGIE